MRMPRFKIQFSLLSLAFLILCLSGFLAGYRGGYDSGAEDKRLRTVVVKTYDVKDLIEQGNAPENPSEKFDTLTKLIQTTVAPSSWQSDGNISRFESNSSLVVTQTGEVHNQIADLLAQLRELRKLHDERIRRGECGNCGEPMPITSDAVCKKCRSPLTETK